MKVVFLLGSLNQGGAEFQLLTLAKLFKSKGNNVKVIALTDYDFYLSYILENEIDYFCFQNSIPKIKKVFLVSKKLKHEKPDIVISYLKIVNKVAILARIYSGFKFKLLVGERTSLRLTFQDIFYFNFLKFANWITVNSIPKFNYIVNNFSIIKNKVWFLPNIIDVNKFNIYNQRFFSDIEFNLSYIGRISPEKNIISLIKAVNILCIEGYNIKLKLYGEFKNKKYLQEVNELLLEINNVNTISLIGPIKDIKSIYDNSDLICLISNYEGFSNVLSEALACGVPIIASDIEENRYLVEDGKNGFLVDQTNIKKIAEGIKRFLVLSNNERKMISVVNRIKAEFLFDSNKIYSQYMEIINKGS